MNDELMYVEQRAHAADIGEESSVRSDAIPFQAV